MTENTLNALIRQRALSLQEKRKSLLNLPVEQVVEKILDADRPVELVHSFPEGDLYLLINDIGPEDALPIISLASAKQWEYLLDMEVWEGDRVNLPSATQWLDLLLAADPERLSQWCVYEQIEFTELLLLRNIEVGVREEEQDPSDFGEEFFTFDDIFYFRVRELPITVTSHAGTDVSEFNEHYHKQRKKFFLTLLQKIAANDFQRYQNLLQESVSIIPSETEEELYRLRNVRLAEKGFFPREEAVGVYQPIRPLDIRNRQAKFIEKESKDVPLPPTPLSTGILLKEDTHFTRALASIDQTLLKMQLQSEFAGLCNSIIVADREKIQTRQALGGIVTKACGYISIGLEYLSEDHRKLIRTYPLSDIFRVGYGKALELKWKAEKWQKDSWYMKTGFRLNFWGDPLMGVIGGLLIKKPLFFDNYETGVIYREFLTGDDIRNTEKSLDEVISLETLFSCMQIDTVQDIARSVLTYKNLLLTLWAAHHQGLYEHTETISGIPLAHFQAFFSELWDVEISPHIIKPTMKTSFLKWLSTSSGLSGTEITNPLGKTFENLFREIENEYAGVSIKNLDPRFIHLFWVVA